MPLLSALCPGEDVHEWYGPCVCLDSAVYRGIVCVHNAGIVSEMLCVPVTTCYRECVHLCVIVIMCVIAVVLSG